MECEEVSENIKPHLEEEMLKKLQTNRELRVSLEETIPKIKKALREENYENYEVRVKERKDIEVENWKENIILVKVNFEDIDEKLDIWKKVDKIVEEYEQDKGVLTHIEKLEEFIDD